MAVYLATENGQDTDKAATIRDVVCGTIVEELNQGFEATTEEWATGLAESFEKIIQALPPASRRQARLFFAMSLKDSNDADQD